MDQPQLPEMKPYVNRNLFSDHFLRELLPDDESWVVDEDKLRLATQATLNLYAPRADELPHLNEAQLEQEFVRPLLESLGHVFQVQPSLPTPEGVRRPDYAFFATREDKRQAGKHKGKIDYFKRSIAIGDAKQWGRPLDKRQRRGADKFDMLSPSWQIDYYLRTSEAPWAILTDGRFWRLYNRETSFRLDIYYEIDLPQILAARDLEEFKYFHLFFRREAFIRDPEGLCFLDRVYQGSLEYARKVGDDLKDSVYRALRILAEGFIETPGNNLDPSRDLEAIHGNALIYLYRLLFINYAEDRRLLPRDTPLYKETYGLVSMEGEIASKLERQESLSPLQATYWEKLRVLFDLINRGSEPFGIDKDTLFVPPYNGGLFDPQHHPFLEENKVADRWLAQVMDLLARSKGEGPGRAFVDYSSLDVRHLGSIYEGLLEYKLRVADEEMAAIRRRGREEWVSAREAEGKRVLERLQPGQLHLVTDRGERKATGSFYTPDYIVKYIVENTLGPLIEEKMEEQDPIEAILSLKVLDPAMGSGHFLVEATDRLAHALVQALGGSEEEPEEDDIRWARREVVERCIYGVDLNPLAVELAKLSLWLHTVAEGKPLNFLDHHLKVGNSLIGAWVDELGTLPKRKRRTRTFAGEELFATQASLFDQTLSAALPTMLDKVLQITKRPSDRPEHIKGKEAVDRDMRELKAPFEVVADLWVSTYFGNEVTEGEYQDVLNSMGEPKKLFGLPVVQRAMGIAEGRRLFHWELEFPEVFYEESTRQENPGFDAVVGNPPYVRVQELQHADIDYFKSTFDTAHRRIDISILFFETAVRLLSKQGRAAYISSIQFLSAEYGRRLRQLLLRNTIHSLLDFKDLPVFEAATTYPGIVVFSAGTAASFAYFEIRKLPPGDRQPLSLEKGLEVDPVHLNDDAWELVDERSRRLLDRLRDRNAFTPLAQCAETWGGVITGKDEVFNLEQHDMDSWAIERQILLPLVRGPDVDRWSTHPSMWLLYPYEKTEAGETRLISEIELKRDYPNAYAYLKAHERELRARKDSRGMVGDSADWYKIIRHGSHYLFESEKILTPGESITNSFAVDPSGAAFSFARVYAVIAKTVDTGFLASVLNSSILEFALHSICPLKRGGYFTFSSTYLANAPIRRIEFTSPPERRAQLAEKGRKLCERRLSQGNASVLEFVARHLAWDETDIIHDLLSYLARQMIEMNRDKQAEAKGFLDWLAGYTGLPIEKWRLKTIVKAYWEHDWDAIGRALSENRKGIEQASGQNVEGREALEAIQREYDQSVAKLEPLLQRIASTDRLINLIVYRLYGLTEEEVAIVEGE